MSIFNRVKYDGPGKGNEWLVYKYPSEDITYGSQLIVNESQEALFLKSGSISNKFNTGRYTLESANIPFLKNFINIPFGNKTPFPAELYFVNKASKLDMKWGTPDRFPLRDPKFGILVEVGAFGQFGLKVNDSEILLREIVGVMQKDELSDYTKILEYFKGVVITKTKESIAERITKQEESIFEITASISELSDLCKTKIEKEFDKYGLGIQNYYITSINIPQENHAKLKEILDKKMEMDQLGFNYKTGKIFETLGKAAANEGPGGLGASLGVGLGTGKLIFELIDEIKQDSSDKGKKILICNSCGFENNFGVKFCGNCAKSLIKVCPNCNASIENPNSKFCNICGSKL